MPLASLHGNPVLVAATGFAFIYHLFLVLNFRFFCGGFFSRLCICVYEVFGGIPEPVKKGGSKGEFEVGWGLVGIVF